MSLDARRLGTATTASDEWSMRAARHHLMARSQGALTTCTHRLPHAGLVTALTVFCKQFGKYTG